MLKDRRPKSKSPFTNIENACVYLALTGNAGHETTKHVDVRKYMFLQRFGSMTGWSSGYYTQYFRSSSHYFRSRYVLHKSQRNSGTTLFIHEDNGCWTLTSKGWSVAYRCLNTMENHARFTTKVKVSA